MKFNAVFTVAYLVASSLIASSTAHADEIARPCRVGNTAPTLGGTVGAVSIAGKLKARSVEAVAAIVSRADPTNDLGWYVLDEKSEPWVLFRRGAHTPDALLAIASVHEWHDQTLLPAKPGEALPEPYVLVPCDAR